MSANNRDPKAEVEKTQRLIKKKKKSTMDTAIVSLDASCVPAKKCQENVYNGPGMDCAEDKTVQ